MNRKRTDTQLVFETLEPRLLLSGDLAPFPALQGHDHHNGVDLTVTVDAERQAIVVIDNTQHKVIERHKLAGHDQIQLTGTSRDDHFTIDLDAAEVDFNRIQVKGGKGTDTLTGPSADATWTLDKSGKGYLDNVAFQGIENLVGSEEGDDTLAGPRKGATWVVDGEGDGTILETAFTGIDHLVGGARGPDTLILHPLGGSTPGTLLNHGHMTFDGGTDMDDRLIIEGNNLQNVDLTRGEGHSGVTEVDGLRIEHSRLEHVQLRSLDSAQDVAANVTWTAQPNDAVTVGDDTSDSTQITITGNDAHDDTTIAKPSASLTILAPNSTPAIDANPSVTINTLTLPGVDFTVEAGKTGVDVIPLAWDYAATITVAPSAVITTASDTADGGDVTFTADTINLSPGALIAANQFGHSGGNVAFTVDNRREATGFILDQITNSVTSRDASIMIADGAEIRAGTLNLTAIAGDRSLDGSVSDSADGAYDGLIKIGEDLESFVGIPISILVKKAQANIQVGNATLFAVGDISINATAETDGTGQGTFFKAPGGIPGGLAFVYIQTDATANIDFLAGTVESRSGDVAIETTGTTSAVGSARVSQNFGRSDSPESTSNVQGASSVGKTALTSTITLAARSRVNAGAGDVSITATGYNTNTQTAETESYKDGLAGFSLALALTDANVKVTALGGIITQATQDIANPTFDFNPFTAIDTTADTIAVGDTTGYKTGDAIRYDANSGGPPAGLQDQHTYYAIVVDGTHLQLAASRPDAAAGTAIDFKPLPTFEGESGASEVFAFDEIQESTGSFIFDYQPGFQVGSGLYYNPVAGQHIDGLVAKDTNNRTGTLYLVDSITQNPDAPSQWLVKLHRLADGSAVTPTQDPAILGSDGTAHAFALAGSALILKTAQPGFQTGQAFTYSEALGFHIPTLTDGSTYYLVKDPDDTTNTEFRLATSVTNATTSDGFSNTVALGAVDQNVMSGTTHTLTAVNPGGVSVTATVTTTDGGVTKSGQGGEPETSDAATKGELLPVLGTLLGNLRNVGNPDGNGGTQNSMDNLIDSRMPAGSNSANDFAGAATVGFVDSRNTASVELGGTIATGGSLTADADIAHKIQTQAEGVRAPSHDGATKANIAGAAAVGMAYDTASVTVDSGASLDAEHAIALSAEVTYPFLVPLDSPSDFFNFLENQLASDPLGSLSGLLGNIALLKQDFVNSWARAVDNDAKADVSVAGAVDFQHRETTATVDVMGGAKLNQDTTTYRASTQSVSLDAHTDIDMINIGGIFDYDLSVEGILKAKRAGLSNAVQPYGAQGGKVGFGGAFRVLELDTTTHAIIHGSDTTNGATQVYTDPGQQLNLNALNEGFVLGITQSGASAGKFGISGSGAYTTQTTNTVAAILSGATVNAGRAQIFATEDTILPTFSGDVVKGRNLGVGLGLVYNDMNRTTQAYIGDPTGVSSQASNVTVGNLTMLATTAGGIFGFALAGSEADNDSASSSGSSSSSNYVPIPLDPRTRQPMNPSQSQAPSSGNYGVAVSGDVVYISTNDVTYAGVDDAGTIKVTSGSAFIESVNETQKLALTGSAAIASGDQSKLGLAGSYSENRINDTTSAQINRATVVATQANGVIGLNAVTKGFATTVAAGGAGGMNHADKSAEIAGSVAINTATPTTLARIGNGAKVTSGGAVTILAQDELLLYALAGAASFGGKQGIGAAVAVNVTHFESNGERVAAQVSDSTIMQTGVGSLSLQAQMLDPSGSKPRLVAVAGSLGQGASVAVSGTIAVNDLGVPSGNAVETSIAGSTFLLGTNANAAVTLDAKVNQTVIGVGGEVAVATGTDSTFALGLGIAYTQSMLPVKAFITASDITASEVAITAESGGTITTTSAGAGVATESTGLAGSAAVNVLQDDVSTYVDSFGAGQAIRIPSAALLMTSNYAPTISAAAGELSVGTNSGGAALALNDQRSLVQATLGSATLHTGGVQINSNVGGEIIGVAVGGAGGEKFALGGSVALTFTDTRNYASSTGGTISTPGSIKIATTTAVKFVTAAGALAIVAGKSQGVAAIGIANATLIRNDDSEAWAGGGATIDFGGAGSVSVPTAVSGNEQTTPFSGFSITTVVTDDITTASAGGAGGAATVGGAGSASVTDLTYTTSAAGAPRLLLPDTLGNSSINIFAYNDTKVGSGAGGLGAATQVGVGAGVDVVSIKKNTQAQFLAGTDVNLSGNLLVQALSREDLLSVAVGLGLSPSAGIAGAASAYVLDLTTNAQIGNDTDEPNAPRIVANGSVLLASKDDTNIDQFPGGAGIAGETGIGAAVGVVDVKNKTVTATVAAGTSITAHATGAGVQAASGEFQVGFVNPTGAPGDVPPPNVTIDTAKQTGNHSASPLTNKNFTQERTATPIFQNAGGIAVSAINTGKLKGVNFAVSGAATAAVDVDAGVDIINMTTHASIDKGAQLNSTGDVILASGADLQKLGVTGAVAGAGEGSGAAGADVTVVNMNTGTYLHSDPTAPTSIQAGGNVIMNAQAQEDLFAITAAFAASGTVSLDAGATVIKVDNTTYSGVDSPNAIVHATGNVQIDAADDTTSAGVTGEGAVGLLGGAFGGSGVITLIKKDTTAELNGARVDGLAKGNTTMTVLDGSTNDGRTGLETKTIKGVGVQATSSETVEGVAVGGAGGLYIGAGAGVAVTIIDSDTTARVDNNSQINSESDASAAQDVSVVAGNRVSALTIGGGLGVGIGGIGAGLDLGFVRNDTTASVDSGSTVIAAGEADVAAAQLDEIESYGMSAGLGAGAGLAGSISIWNIGTGVNSGYDDLNSGNDDALSFYTAKKKDPSKSTPATIDAQTNRTDLTGLLGSYGNTGGANAGEIQAAMSGSSSSLQSSQPSNEVTHQFADQTQNGTVAQAMQGSIQAGTIDVIATTTVVPQQITGGVSVGAASVGGSVNIINRADTTTAAVDSALQASSIEVSSLSTSQYTSDAFGGEAGLVALGAQVAVIRDNSSAGAFLSPNAIVIGATQGLSVGSGLLRSATTNSEGIDVGGVGAGAGISRIEFGGEAITQVQSRDIEAGKVDITAGANLTANPNSTASGGGLLTSAIGNVTLVGMSPTVVAVLDSLSPGAKLTTTGDVNVSATSFITGNSNAKGFSEGIGGSFSGSYAFTDVRPTLDAHIGVNNIVTGANVKVNAAATENLQSNSTANAGFTLIFDGSDAVSELTITNNSRAFVAGDVTANGDLDIIALHDANTPTATATGIDGEGLGEVGFSVGQVTINSNVQAYIDQGTAQTQKGSGGDITISADEQGYAVSKSTTSSGVYAGGDNLESQARATTNTTTAAFVGSPAGNGQDSVARVISDGDLTIESSSVTQTAPQAYSGPNAAFFANNESAAEANTTKTTIAYLGGGTTSGVTAGAKGKASITAMSTEDLSPASQGFNGDGVEAKGSATTVVNLTRTTNVDISGLAALSADSVNLDAESVTTSSGYLQDNQGLGNYQSAFHAGEDDSLAGSAHPFSTFNIGQSVASGTSVTIDGMVHTGAMTVTAHTQYDLEVDSFGWVTAAAGSTDLHADSRVNSADDVLIQFGVDASVTASDSLALSAGLAGSSVKLLTKIHYSEAGILPSPHSDTNATTVMTGLVAIDNNDDGTAVTSPHITAQTNSDLGVDLHWLFTTGSNNSSASYRSHVLDSTGNKIEVRNDFANTQSLSPTVDAETGWLLIGDDSEEADAGRWIEIDDPHPWHGRPSIGWPELEQVL